MLKVKHLGISLVLLSGTVRSASVDQRSVGTIRTPD